MRFRRYFDEDKVIEVRSKLKQAFKVLRKEHGMIALANHLCCQNCAGSDIANRIDAMPLEKANKVNGIVFWHHQDNDDLKERGQLFLAYGDIECSGHNKKFGYPTKKVGEIIVNVLTKFGVTVEWDGNPNTRILVKA